MLTGDRHRFCQREDGLLMETKGRLAELRAELKTRTEALERFDHNAIKIEDNGGVVVASEDAKAFRRLAGEAREIKGLIDDIEFATNATSYLAQPEGTAAGIEAAARAAGFSSFAEAKSLGERFTDSEEFKSLNGGQAGLTMRQAWEVTGEDFTAPVGMGRKDVYTDMVGAVTPRGMVAAQRDALVPRAQRRARVRDLFPVANTQSNLIDFFRVIGFGANRLDLTSGARPVADRTAADGVSAGNAVFGLKPKSNLTFEVDQAPVRTIAHYEVAHRNVLADIPQMQATINNELLYGLRLEEDRQILAGSGTGEDLRGVLNTPGIQAYTQANNGAGAATEPKSDALRRAATKAILAYYEPTGYVLHPNDWEDIELQKGSGDGQYMFVANIAVGMQAQAWRQPVVDTPAIAEGTFLTGAWGLGAQLYDRQQANLRVAEQHADFFIRNAVVILAEERLALAVKRPESFVKGTFIG